MKYGETTKPNGLRSVERGPNIAKTLPLQSVGQSGGPTNRNHNKAHLVNYTIRVLIQHHLI